jgi:hypothetical protein
MRAEVIVSLLNAKRVGSCWMARCPAHDDRTPSLSIRAGSNGSAILKCFGGCDRAAILAQLDGHAVADRRGRGGPAADQSDTERTAIALRVWADAVPAPGTLVERYLRSRGITAPIPDDLRFAPMLKHSIGIMLPAMVAVVRDTTGAPVAIHRTFLAHDGDGKANVVPSKMMLGPCRQAVVRLAEPMESLLIGEGIETCLAAMTATGIPSWAALSASGLRTIVAPRTVTNIVVLADGDAVGEAAAVAAALRLRLGGRRIRVARPPSGTDFNDLLINGDNTEEGAR